MHTYIHHIATLAAPYPYQQDCIRDRMKSWTQCQRSKRLLHALYQRSGIKTRYSVIDDFNHPRGGGLFKIDEHGIPSNPTTAERNGVFSRASREMSVSVARSALTSSGFTREEVTHVVYASCTGFVNPGPDFYLVQDLGLKPSVERYTIGFMGCYAAFPALRMADQFCQARKDAVVLVVCLELCTLHMQLEDRQDAMLANSLFADGAGAAIVSAREPSPDRPSYRMDGFASAVLPQGESEMAWDVGNHGFDIKLSSYVPEILGSELQPLLQRMLLPRDTACEMIEEWAVHPGGRAILDKVESGLGLSKTALTSSRRTLHDYGNMSSATVLFVLKDLLQSAQTSSASTCAVAFGPGLTVETALLQRTGCPAPRRGVELLALQTLHDASTHG
ncbi:MAG: type III polyketide synthase [Roseimicrobium sp.]